jgi:hypothetical protein
MKVDKTVPISLHRHDTVYTAVLQSYGSPWVPNSISAVFTGSNRFSKTKFCKGPFQIIVYLNFKKIKSEELPEKLG